MRLDKPYTNAQRAEFINNANNENLLVTEYETYIEALPVVKSLEELQAEKTAEMKAARDFEEQEYFVYDGNKYDGDVISITRLQVASGEALKQFDNPDYVQYWTDYDNNIQALTPQDMLDIMTAVKNHSQNVHTKYAMKKAEIDAATLGNISDITWES